MSKNVMIPMELLQKIIYVLEHFDMDTYDQALKIDYDSVLFALYKKNESLSLRDSYAKIIYAKDEDSRHFARMQYLQQKRAYKEDI
jgi:hypothetical protein